MNTEPPKSEAHRVVARVYQYLEIARARACETHGLRHRAAAHGAYDGQIWSCAKTIREGLALPTAERAAEILIETLRLEVEPLAAADPQRVRLLWPPIACSDQRARWIIGSQGAAAIASLEARERAERARELPPGAVARRLAGPPRGDRMRPGEAPPIDERQRLALDSAFDAAFGGAR